jgi:hypothetical protein
MSVVSKTLKVNAKINVDPLPTKEIARVVLLIVMVLVPWWN